MFPILRILLIGILMHSQRPHLQVKPCSQHLLPCLIARLLLTEQTQGLVLPLLASLGPLSPPSPPVSPPHNEGTLQLPAAGECLLAFVPFWTWHVPNLWVQSVISKGYKIEFISLPSSCFLPFNLPASAQKTADLLVASQQFHLQWMVVSVPSEERFQGF